jgi:hypothetical protein
MGVEGAAVVLLFIVAVHPSTVSAQRVDPYEAEGIALELGRTSSLKQLDQEAQRRATAATIGLEFATVAELYKRLGSPLARTFYEKAIAADPREPAWEYFYAAYLRLYRGAGQRPLFTAAARHLFEARRKLEALRRHPADQQAWDERTLARVVRLQAALYERDGLQLASRAEGGDSQATRIPWLFLSAGARIERASADFDQSSDTRLLSSAARYSASLGHTFTDDEYRRLAEPVDPKEVGARLRVRPAAGPVLDVSFAGRHIGALQITDFTQPTVFNDVKLLDFGVGAHHPFTIGGGIDAMVQGSYRRIAREGLIEHLPRASEQLDQVNLGAAMSRYVGPDRLNLSFLHTSQRIDPEPDGQPSRTRRFNGGAVSYQIFRPLPRRDFNSGAGRYFQTRGIDLTFGFLDDTEHFPGDAADVSVTRRDVYVGVAAKGLGPVDVAVQPTWFSSRVSNDVTQDNGHFRLAGSVLARLLDEERTPEMPTERLLGLAIASLHVVVPFHWDVATVGPPTFASRGLGAELWTKLMAAGGRGVTVLAAFGYGSDWTPEIGHRRHLGRAQVTIGF